jgi:hypothetical protein
MECTLVNTKISFMITFHRFQDGATMNLAKTEQEWAERAVRHIKVELKRADVTYEELAKRLEKHGFKETKASIANKLARATVPAAFFLACLAALELEGVRLEDL